MNTRRLFFALWPDMRQRDSLRDVIGSVAKTVEGTPTDRRNWHVTLAYVGVFPEQRIPILFEKTAAIDIEPFHLHFDRMEFWPRQKIAAICAQTVPPELQRLVEALKEAIASVGVPVEDRNYRPHITAVRNTRHFATERLALRATTEWSGFELMESISGPGGAMYRPLKQSLTD